MSRERTSMRLPDLIDRAIEGVQNDIGMNTGNPDIDMPKLERELAFLRKLRVQNNNFTMVFKLYESDEE